MSVEEYVDLSDTDVTRSIVMTVNEIITSATTSETVECVAGRQSLGVGLSAEVVERIQSHDLTYRSDCAVCVSHRSTGVELAFTLVPLHLMFHLPATSRAGVSITFTGTAREPGGVLVTLHDHTIGQVVGIASGLGVVCTAARRVDPDTVCVRFGGSDYLFAGVSLQWFARESDVKDLLTMLPGIDVKERM